MKDDALKVCPKDRCPRKTWARGKVTRQMSGGAGLIFKGSGFYITDYRSDGYKQAAKKDSESATPKSDSGGKSESKPAATTSSPAKSTGTKPAKS
jgi:predicted nucleic acid-binding Zn ribbon protein